MLNQQIGQYKITQLLGEGGMAHVYLAEKGNLGKKVALKVLKKEFLFNSQIRGRFLAEAKNMIRLNHPNIVAINDLIDEEDFVAIELEYIEGETLKEYLQRKGALPDDEIEHFLRQMLGAVEYIHQKGFVHRDIKPSNFMLTASGVIKLTDFGIAKNMDGTNIDYTGTGTGMVLGTPKYMSPEQVRNTKDVTAQSDVYSLGVVLWEMATGKVPYDINTESTFDVFTKIVNEPLAKTGTKWDGVIEKATKKESGERKLELKFEQPKPVEKPKAPEQTQGKKSKDTKFIIGAIVVGVFIVLFGVWLDTKDKNNKAEVLDVEMATNEEIPEWKKEFEKKWDEAVATEPFNNAKTNYKHFYNLPELPDSAKDEKQRAEDKMEYYYDKILAENPNLFIDKRDGKMYQSVKIGNQTWMAENLAYKPSYGKYWAYDDDVSNVDKYGYLYDWKTACKVCPDGWHLPSYAEWTRLIDYLGGEDLAGYKMKSKSGWKNGGNGSDLSGFSGHPSGLVDEYNEFYFEGEYGIWWLNKENNQKTANNISFNNVNSYVFFHDEIDKQFGFSVRCIKE